MSTQGYHLIISLRGSKATKGDSWIQRLRNQTGLGQGLVGWVRGCTNDQTGDQEGGLSTEVQIYLCWNGGRGALFFTGAELLLAGLYLKDGMMCQRRMSPGWEEEGEKTSWWRHGSRRSLQLGILCVAEYVRALLSGVSHLSFNQGPMAYLRARLALFLVLGITCELNIHGMSCPPEER